MARDERGRGVYDWWSGHQRLFGVLSTLLLFGKGDDARARGVTSLALDPGDTVLDVGCGPGVNFPALREAVGPDGTVVGLDYSAGMCHRARKRVRKAGWENVHVVRGDAARPPFETPFDAAYATLSMTAMPEATAVIDAVYDSLRPGGRFVVVDTRPIQDAPWDRLNPLFTPISRLATNWLPDVDVVGALRDTFETYSLTEYNGGTLYVATATREDGRAADTTPLQE
ncbi:methylase involved in ubiquinone/menaquinone biosynthesis [Halogeometricum borinquense DSM 11551]|uniref:Methylase involved in ubiquinone/menaquinone biosynthesis n=1 Tax=Halogeometricum borinquense (strain ATCC 700274 / DSM 11551 / JCM 10706 / KCTC 4070 / PR3) TaxID=469382 RepID=E4NLE6_HALBP|nr:methyltransferase domain-containing protein [Halogeometricum borinquense]ADQ66042.1 methylase involved in ubiquinone/menaquinone biosynthesis [Halogeometricum borinquense DSM 11551]ELY27461.1 methylase involved in ubiquinone/menaquinone biosynthesis [Halogeometricum borinquense DSM 11551]